MVLATDMKFLGKGTPAGQRVVEYADVKRGTCAAFTIKTFMHEYGVAEKSHPHKS